MFKNICNWSKCIHEPIFEVSRSDHIVDKGVCSRSVIGKTVRVLVVARKDNELQRELFQSLSGGSTDHDTVPKATELTSNVYSSILRSRKEWLLVKRLQARTQRAYPDVQCQVLVCTMSPLDPCRIEINFLSNRYIFVCQLLDVFAV